MHRVVLPELGEGIEKAVVACWHCRVGDQVNQEDDIVEVVTDKATFNIPSPAKGEVKEILFQEGREAKIGETLAIIS